MTDLERSQVTFRVQKLKKYLLDTDYRAIKYAEGILTLEDFQETKDQRIEWRTEINVLQEQLDLAKEERRRLEMEKMPKIKKWPEDFS